MNIWRSLTGIMDVELTSAAPEDAITAINRNGTDILCLQRCGDLTCRFQISRKDYPQIKALAEKRGEVLRLIDRKGLFWQARGLLTRPVLLAGLCILGILVLMLPSRVLFVRVSGNHTIPDKQILSTAEDCGIHFGASRRKVRSEKVKNALLSEVPQLQWVGVNTAGCVATISVRERADPESMEERPGVSSIIAARDGYILSATVTSGNPLFQIGQTVQEGQTLVSGYTDCGLSIQATRSSAEIYAQTNRSIHAVTLELCREIQAAGKSKHRISLRIRKKRIKIWKDSGIYPMTCGRMYKEYCLPLPGGFQLPVALCVETFVPYDLQDVPVSRSQAERALDRFAKTYLLSQMAAGEIQSSDRQITHKDGAYHLQGEYICIEMIGRELPEQIGEQNGKNN